MDRDHAHPFLIALFTVVPNGRVNWLQIKCLDPLKAAKPFAYCYRFADADKGLAVAERYGDAQRHVFVSVNPRFRPGGKKIDVDGVVALPFDYDSMDRALEAAAKFKALGLKVGLEVHSGRGAHVYLLLDRYEQRVEEAQDVGRRLCRFTGSDAVHARSQVMRLPGTRNWKKDANGTMATLVACDPSLRYSLEEIRARMDAAGVPVPPVKGPATPRPPRPVALFEHAALEWEGLDGEEASRQHLLHSFLSSRYQNLAKEGVPRGNRSEALFGLCRVLFNLEASEDEVETFIRLRPHGIGEVVVEKGLCWLSRSIENLLASPGDALPEPLAPSTVQVCNIRKPLYSESAEVGLHVLDGPFRGQAVRATLRFTRAAQDPWRFCWMAFGESPAPLGDWGALQRLVGKAARVVLAQEGKYLNVKMWLPAGR